MVNVLIFFALIASQVAAMPYTLFRENGMVGLKNSDGKVIIPAQYERLGWSNGEFSIVNNVTGCKSSNAWALISLENQRVTRHEYDELLPAESNIIIAKKKLASSPRPLVGAISPSGKVIIPFTYDGISISSMRAVVFSKIGNQFRYGLVDLENKTLIPQQYQDIRPIGSLRYAVRNFEGKIALFSDAGKQIGAFTIDSISSFKKGYAVVYEGKFQGLIDRGGVVKLPSKFREIKIGDDGRISTRESDEWFFLDGKNNRIKSLRADSVSIIDKDLYKVEIGGQVQITDNNFKPVVPGVFNGLSSFNGDKAIYYLGGLAGVIQKDGTVVIPALYKNVISTSNYFLVNSGTGGHDTWILFDGNGSRLSQKTFQKIVPVTGGNFAVRNKGFWGLLNASGTEILASIYDSLLQFRDNHVVVKFKGLNGVIDFNERWVVSPRANALTLIGNDRFLETSSTSVNLKGLSGGSVIYFTSNKIVAHEGYLQEFLPSGNVWKIDFNGVIVDRTMTPTEPTDLVFEESEGYRAIKRNGRYGFIDSKGRLRIANRYEGVRPFQEGFAGVKILGKWGFINIHENITVQPVYEEVFPFKNGRALVKQKDLFGLVDTSGKLILPVRYESIERLGTGNLRVRINRLCGLADNSGKVLITPRYDELIDAGNGFVVARKDGMYGIVSLDGISTVPLMYDLIRYDPVENVFLALKRSDWTSVAP